MSSIIASTQIKVVCISDTSTIQLRSAFIAASSMLCRNCCARKSLVLKRGEDTGKETAELIDN